jgi:peptidyl-prolyl cis-trans isomerase C
VRNNHWFFKSILCAAIACILCGASIAPGLAQEKDKVLAKIGNETISEKDLQIMADSVPERFRQLYADPEGRKQALDYIVNVYVIAAEAEKQGLPNSDKFKRLMTFAKKDLMARLYLEDKTKDVPAPTDAEAKDFYEKNKDQFRSPESVHLRHILVKTDKEANDILAKLKKGGDFADLAGKHSICPSRSRGGDLDWLSRGRLVKEIEDVAFSMNKGEVTGPVQTKFGFHVVYLEDKKPERVNSFDEVKDYILEQIGFRKQQEYYQKLSDELRKKMNVQITAEDAPAKPVPTGGPKPGPKQ